MSNTMKNTFSDISELKAYIKEKKEGCFVFDYVEMPDYPGIFFEIAIIFDFEKESYRLDLRWTPLGLDFYGDTLVENYMYEFGSLEKLLSYLEKKYSIGVRQISKKLNGDRSKYPDPFKDADKKTLFEEEWKRFSEDFKKGRFLDDSLNLVGTNGYHG